jgi:hypothetical protein
VTNKPILEERIGQWRQYLRSQAVHSADVEEPRTTGSQIDDFRGAARTRTKRS